jgi:hypothetical protein
MQKMPNNFLIMMEPKTVTNFESTLFYGTKTYKYAAQVNFNSGIISNHFSTTAVIADGTYIEYTGKKCKKLEVPEVSKCVLMLYVQQNSELPPNEFLYNANSNKFFSKYNKKYYDKNSEKIKERMKEQMKKHYDNNPERKKESVKKYNEKVNLKSKHKSGFESVCISCCRLGNNTHLI